MTRRLTRTGGPGGAVPDAVMADGSMAGASAGALRGAVRGPGGAVRAAVTDQARARWSGLLVLAAGVVLVSAVASTAQRGVVQPGLACAFGAFIALGEVLRITLPGDRDAAPLGVAASLAYALVSDVHGAPSRYGPSQVVAVTACAMLVGLLPHITAGRLPRPDDLARRILAVALAAWLFRPAYVAGHAGGLRGHPALLAASLLVVVAAVTLVDGLLAACSRCARDGVPLRAACRDEVGALLGISTAVGATGLLIAMVTGMMSVWAIPVFCVPLLLAQFAFRRYADVRSTYLQTIQSLSRVTEVAGYTEAGHARRVSRLALAVGRDLGMPERALLDLQYAALMHDIGQLCLTDPIPGGATVLADLDEQRRIARRGGEVIRQTGVMDGVARLVERQAETCRAADPPPLGSRIIRVVNAYDDLAGGTQEAGRRQAALERLRLGAARDREYDPDVVEALGRIVGRQRG